ncbi:hypothetical protein J7M23_01265 [Candidatus Sumerlaeota bacterium]|nr:hypothetical protein [Candidatus Sumerlaeota bacterium]
MIIHWYNYRRPHSAIGFVTPAAKHSGRAEEIIKERQRKLERARALRSRRNKQNKSKKQLFSNEKNNDDKKKKSQL